MGILVFVTLMHNIYVYVLSKLHLSDQSAVTSGFTMCCTSFEMEMYLTSTGLGDSRLHFIAYSVYSDDTIREQIVLKLIVHYIFINYGSKLNNRPVYRK